jgi:hypothetical protein
MQHKARIVVPSQWKVNKSCTLTMCLPCTTISAAAVLLPCRPGLLLPGVSLFGLYQFGAPEMQTLKDAVVDELLENSSMDREEADTWGNALSFHHQWMVLSREHAAALVHHSREIILVRGWRTAGGCIVITSQAWHVPTQNHVLPNVMVCLRGGGVCVCIWGPAACAVVVMWAEVPLKEPANDVLHW